jgi:hypothetical protein
MTRAVSFRFLHIWSDTCGHRPKSPNRTMPAADLSFDFVSACFATIHKIHSIFQTRNRRKFRPTKINSKSSMDRRPPAVFATSGVLPISPRSKRRVVGEEKERKGEKEAQERRGWDGGPVLLRSFGSVRSLPSGGKPKKKGGARRKRQHGPGQASGMASSIGPRPRPPVWSRAQTHPGTASYRARHGGREDDVRSEPRVGWGARGRRHESPGRPGSGEWRPHGRNHTLRVGETWLRAHMRICRRISSHGPPISLDALLGADF